MSRTVSLILLVVLVGAGVVAGIVLGAFGGGSGTREARPEAGVEPDGHSPARETAADVLPALPIEVTRIETPPMAPTLDRTDVLVREAVEGAADRVRTDPSAAWAWEDLARTYHANQFIPEAATCYEQALARDGSLAKAAYLLASTAQQRGETARAVALVDHAAALNDGYAPALWRPGFWLLDEGDLEGSEARFERAREASRTDDAPLFGLARVHIMRGEVDEAIRILEEELASSSNRAYRDQLLGAAYRRAGRPEKAAEVASRATRGMPVWRDPWLQEIDDLRTGYIGEMARASRLIDRSMHREAISILEDLREHYPEEEALLINLAIAHTRLGDRARALELLRSILAFKPESHLAHQNIGAMLSTMAAESGSAPDEAFAHLDRALEINPRDPRPHVVKGDYYMSVRDAERAISAFEAAIEMDPRHVEAIEKIGNIHALERRLDEALARYERIVEIDPKADPIWIRIASIHAVEGRPAQAQRALDEAMKRIPASNQQIQALQQRINQMSRPGDG